jgi:hypothetical protein
MLLEFVKNLEFHIFKYEYSQNTNLDPIEKRAATFLKPRTF